MNLTDSYPLRISQKSLWTAIIDPYVLQQCIPSCRHIKQYAEHQYRADVVVKLGFIKIPFTVNLAISNIIENQSYDLSAEVIDGPAKGTTATSNITLNAPTDKSTHSLSPMGQTVLNYNANVCLNNKLDKINDSIIQISAKKWLDKFFKRLEESIEKNHSIYSI